MKAILFLAAYYLLMFGLGKIIMCFIEETETYKKISSIINPLLDEIKSSKRNLLWGDGKFTPTIGLLETKMDEAMEALIQLMVSSNISMLKVFAMWALPNQKETLKYLLNDKSESVACMAKKQYDKLMELTK